MSDIEESIHDHLEAYLTTLEALEEKLSINKQELHQIIHLMSVASGDLPQRAAEFLLCLATVCPNLKLS